MFVAASSRCFPQLSLRKTLEKLVDLEYSAVEIVIGSGLNDLHPEDVRQHFSDVVRICSLSRLLSPVALFFDLDIAQSSYYDDFVLSCRLARALKIPSISIRSSEHGTPYNEEIERLRKLTRFAVQEGVFLSVLTETDRMTSDVESIRDICRSVPGLKVALDPSYFVYQHEKPINYDALIELTSHVRLRDTTQQKFQVLLGQGVLDFSRLVTQLSKVHYRGALCADLSPLPNVDQNSEMRKMRLLMETTLEF